MAVITMSSSPPQSTVTFSTQCSQPLRTAANQLPTAMSTTHNNTSRYMHAEVAEINTVH